MHEEEEWEDTGDENMERDDHGWKRKETEGEGNKMEVEGNG